MSQPLEYSNLEVDHAARHANAPEVFPYYAPQPHEHHEDDTSKVAYTTKEYACEETQTTKICGLRKRHFWITAIAATILILAAVAGGIGGALASRSSSGSHEAITTPSTQSQVSTIYETSKLTSTSDQPSKTVTTTTIVGPTATIRRDCPSSNDTLHDVTLSGVTMYYRKACENSQPNTNGVWNAVQGITKTLDECIDLCAIYNTQNRTRIRSGEDRICNSVCWRNTFDKINDWEGGHCFGFSSLNSSGTFSFKQPPETRCDSAMLVNQQILMEL